MKKGNKYGTHRVISPKGVLPQPADKLDNNMDEIYDNEILIDVQTLNIDSASFTQIEEQAGGDKAKIAEIMLGIVEKQGKHRNPVTGSGGMLLGTVEKIGDALVGKTDLKVGDKIATLVSLSLTPLRIDKIKEIRADVDQVDINGKAILFESGIYAKIPADLPEKLALSALDVAGAPAQTAKLDFANTPFSRYRLSSNPTLTFPPIAIAGAAKVKAWRPIPVAVQVEPAGIAFTSQQRLGTVAGVHPGTPSTKLNCMGAPGT